WCIVCITDKNMLDHGLHQVDKDFTCFLHPTSKEEYALARTERKTGHGYHGFSLHAHPSVTLEEDLQRRDLTINAMAQAADGRIIDPYGGKADLTAQVLRHVSPTFAEVPFLVLLVARFAARFHHLGYTVAESILALMRTLSNKAELLSIAPERLWQETHTALGEANPHIYFHILEQCGALAILFPELASLRGVPQPKL